MPTYEYGCSTCGSEWEAVQRITDAPLEVCAKCGKASAHRLISAGTGFILKGGGWYSDLYSSAKPSSNKADTKGGTPSDSGGKAETAPVSEGTSKSDAKASTSPPPSGPAVSPPTST